MNCRDFCDVLMEEVMQQSGHKIQVTHRTLVKNNGVVKEALELNSGKGVLSPSIYVDPYYAHFQQGVPIYQLASMMLKNYFEMEEKPSLPEDFFQSFGYVKNRLYCRLVNYENNKETLANVPHERWLDLAIVYYYQLEDQILADATILIQNAHLQHWGVSEELVRRTAWDNTKREMGPVFQTLGSALKEVELEMMGEVFEETEAMEKENNLYLLSNKRKSYGAVSICQPGMANDIGEKLGSDYFVLPSSIHECLILANTFDYSLQELSEMVREINGTQLEPQEVLADHAYLYKRACGEFIF